MRRYEQFHGEIETKQIGKELRNIIKNEKDNFKILTGYGSTCGISISQNKAIRTLNKMKKEGLIKGFLPGNINDILVTEKSCWYNEKMKYCNLIKNDCDFGNEGVIFVFVK